MLEEKTFDTGSVSINYVEGPPSGPPLLLLHGVTGNWKRFLQLLPVLTLRWHVVSIDLRGHGKSGRAPGGYGLMAYAQDVIGLIRHLDDGPAALMGHSLGAMISIGVAAEAPELVRGVVLEDPPLGAFSGRPFAERRERGGFTATRDLLREGLPADALAQRLLAESMSPDALAARIRAGSLSQVDPEVLTFILENRSINGYDLEDRLRRIACPTLLLQGNYDLGGALSDTDAAWAAALLAQGFHVSVPEADHHILNSTDPACVRASQSTIGFLETVR